MVVSSLVLWFAVVRGGASGYVMNTITSTKNGVIVCRKSIITLQIYKPSKLINLNASLKHIWLISVDAYFHEHLWHIKRTYSTKHSQSVTHATLYQIFGCEWLGHDKLPQSTWLYALKYSINTWWAEGLPRSVIQKMSKGFVSKN